MTRVLVVEDEESFSDALSYMLRKEGFEVAVSPTGPDALDTFDRSGADLVLLDLMLPGLPGTEVCRTLRQRSNVPVIMLTAKDTEVDKVVGLELGADDYVTKPFSSRELVARIRAVLRRQGETEELPTVALEAGPVRMDVDRHVVTVRGEQIQLPLKEFELLEVLLRNADRVLTRMQLIDRVWGSTTSVTPRHSTCTSSGCGRRSSLIRPTRGTSSRSAGSATSSSPPPDGPRPCLTPAGPPAPRGAPGRRPSPLRGGGGVAEGCADAPSVGVGVAVAPGLAGSGWRSVPEAGRRRSTSTALPPARSAIWRRFWNVRITVTVWPAASVLVSPVSTTSGAAGPVSRAAVCAGSAIEPPASCTE